MQFFVHHKLSLSRQKWLTMKLLIILMFAGFLQVSATGYSQTVSISGKNIPVKKVFDAVKKQAGYVFFYDADLIRKAKPVTVQHIVRVTETGTVFMALIISILQL